MFNIKHDQDDIHEINHFKYEYKKGDCINLLSFHIEHIVGNNFNLQTFLRINKHRKELESFKNKISSIGSILKD